MAEEKNQKPVSTPEQPDLEVHSDDNKIENNENTEKITRYKKQAARSFVLAFTTLVAIIAICIAWFVSNTKVTMTGTSISAENTVPFELASAGERQDPEKSFMSSLLSAGEIEKYTQYIDCETGETIKNISVALYVGTSGLAWYLNGQHNFYPGADGILEFYIIPKQEGLKKITLQLNLEGYKDTSQGKSVEKSDDQVLENLINGHILIFKHLDDENGYSGWLGTEKELTINAPKVKDTTSAESTSTNTPVFKKNTPYKVTLYWKWPKYFRNYVYSDRTTQGDLFTNTSKDNEDYTSLLEFVENQRPESDNASGESTKNSQLFYSTEQYGYDTNITGQEKIDNQMSDALLESCSTYYNLADEYIGAGAQYIHVEIAAKSWNY